jgi:hypothetical protein
MANNEVEPADHDKAAAARAAEARVGGAVADRKAVGNGAGACQGTLQRAIEEVEKGLFPDLPRRLRDEVEPGVYNELAAYTLAVASGWAYAERDGLVKVMRYLGFGDLVGKELQVHETSEVVQNDALLVKTTVSFLQAGKVGILCFRGTEPTNVLEWLSNMSFEQDRFNSCGTVHSGFYRNLKVVLPRIQGALLSAVNGEPMSRVSTLGVIRPYVMSQLAMEERDLEKIDDFLKALLKEQSEQQKPGLQRMEALYITGHSLGAALAVLAAATIFVDPAYACIRSKVYGVYTFGQPLTGSKVFCDTCNELFGKFVFRHVYENDVVPQLPPTLYGDFYTFGQEYVSTPDGWTRKLQTPGQEVKRADTLIGSALPAALAWYLKKIPFLTRTPDLAGITRFLKEVPLLNRIPEPLLDSLLTLVRDMIVPKISVDDHQPVHYIDCSQRSLPFYK